MNAHAQAVLEPKVTWAEPGAPAGIGPTSSSSAAERKRRHIGSTSFQQHLKKKLLQSIRNAWSCPQQLCLKLDGSMCMCFISQALNKATN